MALFSGVRRVAGRLRRRGRVTVTSEIEWHTADLSRRARREMKKRMVKATDHLRRQTVKNISVPITIRTGVRGGTLIERSRPGEFPRAETRRLMRSIFSDVFVRGKNVYGIVGTTLDYGAILELKMDRSYLRRTMREENSVVRSIMTEKFK